MHPDNWDTIAEKVATKTKEQCILHFLRMPIEDKFVDSYLLHHKLSSNPSSKKSTSPPSSNALGTSSPLMNPVVSLVSFLSNSVNPSMVSAAFNAALECYKSQISSNGKEEEEFTGEIKAAAAACVGESLLRAKVTAQKEELEIKSLVQQVIDLQVKKIELKLQKVEELEKALEKEKREVCNFYL